MLASFQRAVPVVDHVAQDVQVRVAPDELHSWATNFLAHPPQWYLSMDGEYWRGLGKDPLWRRIPAPYLPWIVLRSTDVQPPTDSVQVVSMWSFGGGISVIIRPFETVTLAKKADGDTRILAPGITIRRQP